ncbi:MAG: hypothetical protein ACI8Z7_000514 [Candidatus Nanohaloarchaea archaeon]|jgi:hypothetical protein
MAEDIEETNSGLRKEGDLEEIAEFAGEAEEVIKQKEDEEVAEDFEEWRPRSSDSQEDMKRKTVKSASLRKRNIEEESQGMDDIANAGKKAVEAGKNTVKKKKPEGAGEATFDALRPFFSGSLKALRKVEEKVYSSLMLKFNPYFFDAGDLSADIGRKRNGDYRFDLDTTDEESRKALKQRFTEK